MKDNRTHPRQAPGGLTLAAFGLAVLLGGANFVAVRISNQELAPFWGAGLRFGLAATLFVVLALALRLDWPRGRELAATAVYGALAFGVSYALLYWARHARSEHPSRSCPVVPDPRDEHAATPRADPSHSRHGDRGARGGSAGDVAPGRGSALERLTFRAVAASVLAISGITWMTLGSNALTTPISSVLAMSGATLAIGQSISLASGSQATTR